MRVETVRGCGRTPGLLFALEEMGLEYDLVARPEGAFLREEGTVGPVLVDGGLRVLGVEAAIRHAARRTGRLLPEGDAELARMDMHLELWTGHLRPTAVMVRQGLAAERATQMLETGLSRLEAQLGDGPFLLGERLTLCDCPGVLLARFPVASPRPALDAYLTRLVRRPAWVRVGARLASLGVATAGDPAGAAEVGSAG